MSEEIVNSADLSATSSEYVVDGYAMTRFNVQNVERFFIDNTLDSYIQKIKEGEMPKVSPLIFAKKLLLMIEDIGTYKSVFPKDIRADLLKFKLATDGYQIFHFESEWKYWEPFSLEEFMTFIQDVFSHLATAAVPTNSESTDDHPTWSMLQYALTADVIENMFKILPSIIPQEIEPTFINEVPSLKDPEKIEHIINIDGKLYNPEIGLVLKWKDKFAFEFPFSCLIDMDIDDYKDDLNFSVNELLQMEDAIDEDVEFGEYFIDILRHSPRDLSFGFNVDEDEDFDFDGEDDEDD